MMWYNVYLYNSYTAYIWQFSAEPQSTIDIHTRRYTAKEAELCRSQQYHWLWLALAEPEETNKRRRETIWTEKIHIGDT